MLPASIACPAWASWMVAAVATDGTTIEQRLPMT
jgi:hypothetical protein